MWATTNSNFHFHFFVSQASYVLKLREPSRKPSTLPLLKSSFTTAIASIVNNKDHLHRRCMKSSFSTVVVSIVKNKNHLHRRHAKSSFSTEITAIVNNKHHAILNAMAKELYFAWVNLRIHEFQWHATMIWTTTGKQPSFAKAIVSIVNRKWHVIGDY